ncbi:tyrosine-type recombinase/integrase [Synechococcus sp. PCC 7336]|uniref:tyrosine-type recombinase/integrase n=1 Tax=Synechococcus sp. PCC 7336 TaxID=195250 RepID=UPI000345FE83|nr:tyrosine-type recombinase/integrase [Synechococcus sp. PCC 7336]
MTATATAGMLVAQFLNERERDLARASRRTYRMALEQFSQDCTLPLNDIKTHHIQAFLNNLKGRPYKNKAGKTLYPPASPATYNLKRLALHQFFAWAESRGYCETPLPTRPIRAARLPAKLPRDIDRLMLERVLIRADSHSLRYSALVRVLLECGLRAQETIDLSIQDFQTSAEGSILDVRSGKGSKPRVVAVGEALAELLQEYLYEERFPYSPTDPLFASQSKCPRYRGRPLTYDGLRHVILKLTRDEPGQQTPHQFRHSFATLLLDKGVAPEHIQHLLGHTTAAMTMRYTQRANLRAAIARSREALDAGLV